MLRKYSFVYLVSLNNLPTFKPTTGEFLLNYDYTTEFYLLKPYLVVYGEFIVVLYYPV